MRRKERVFQSGRFKVDFTGREECMWEMHPKHIPTGPLAVRLLCCSCCRPVWRGPILQISIIGLSESS